MSKISTGQNAIELHKNYLSRRKKVVSKSDLWQDLLLSYSYSKNKKLSYIMISREAGDLDEWDN